MFELDVDDELKKNGFLQTKSDYEFKNYLKPKRFADKLNEFGRDFLLGCVALLKLSDEKKIIRSIKRTPGYKQRLLLAETFFYIKKGYQTLHQKCPNRLIDICAETGKDCSLFKCSKIIQI